MNDNLAAQLALLPNYLGHHLLLTISAMSIGICVAMPLAIFVYRHRRLQWSTLGFASVMQTIPGIALLALMVPLLSRIGFLPALIALVLYSLLPILRNTLTGLATVDRSVVEAAMGMGMTPGQMLSRVELPLALPVIIAGVRTATVWVVGTATLSTLVGATSLGNYIFSGLQTQNHLAVVVGCVAAAGLAIVLDGIVRLVGMAYLRRSRPLAFSAATALLVVFLAGLSPLAGSIRSSDQIRIIVVGAKTFTEQYILADLVASILKDAGFSVESKSSMGSTILFQALADDNIDCYIDYTGTIWANVMKRTKPIAADSMLAEMTSWLSEQHGILCLGALGFENAYALAMQRKQAEQLQITSIVDLARHAPRLSIAGDYEFFVRPEWTDLETAYSLAFAQELSMDATLMYSALDRGEIDVISAYSTDGRIAQLDLYVLDDPEQALPPYDAVLLLSPKAAQIPGITQALSQMIEKIDDRTMRWANKLVDVDRISVASAADSLKTALFIAE